MLYPRVAHAELSASSLKMLLGVGWVWASGCVENYPVLLSFTPNATGEVGQFPGDPPLLLLRPPPQVENGVHGPVWPHCTNACIEVHWFQARDEQ